MTFVSNASGLILAIYSALSFFISGYQSFIVDKSMMKMLYGEVADPSDDTNQASDDDGPTSSL